MSSVLFLVVFVAVNLNPFTEAKKPCDVENVACTTEAANVFNKVIADGIPGHAKPSDPLYAKEIKADIPGLEYEMRNVKLAGLGNCTVELLKIDKEKKMFDYNLLCPTIVVTGDYKVEGKFAGFPLEGKGEMSGHWVDYAILFHGKYESIMDDNRRYHFKITDYKFKIDAKGKIEFEFKNLYYGDKEKSDLFHKFLNENWKELQMNSKMRSFVMGTLMDDYVHNINDCMKAVPVAEMLAV